MAKSTKYTVLKKIVNLNGKHYEIGDTVKGLNGDQEQRLQEIGAIGPIEPTETPEPFDTNEGAGAEQSSEA